MTNEELYGRKFRKVALSVLTGAAATGAALYIFGPAAVGVVAAKGAAGVGAEAAKSVAAERFTRWCVQVVLGRRSDPSLSAALEHAWEKAITQTDEELRRALADGTWTARDRRAASDALTDFCDQARSFWRSASVRNTDPDDLPGSFIQSISPDPTSGQPHIWQDWLNEFSRALSLKYGIALAPLRALVLRQVTAFPVKLKQAFWERIATNPDLSHLLQLVMLDDVREQITGVADGLNKLAASLNARQSLSLDPPLTAGIRPDRAEYVALCNALDAAAPTDDKWTEGAKAYVLKRLRHGMTPDEAYAAALGTAAPDDVAARAAGRVKLNDFERGMENIRRMIDTHAHPPEGSVTLDQVTQAERAELCVVLGAAPTRHLWMHGAKFYAMSRIGLGKTAERALDDALSMAAPDEEVWQRGKSALLRYRTAGDSGDLDLSFGSEGMSNIERMLEEHGVSALVGASHESVAPYELAALCNVLDATADTAHLWMWGAGIYGICRIGLGKSDEQSYLEALGTAATDGGQWLAGESARDRLTEKVVRVELLYEQIAS